MSEITASALNGDMAAYLRLAFVEAHANDVGVTALENYVELAPNTGHAIIFANQLDDTR